MNSFYEANNKCLNYSPVWVEGESYFYYFNDGEVLDNLLFSDYILYILDIKFNVVATPSGLKQDSFDGDKYRMYIDPLLIPVLPDGYYRLVVVDDTSNEIVRVTDTFQMINDIDIVNNDTMILNYKHDFNIYNFNYEELLNNNSNPWYNSIRVHLSEIEPSFSYDIESRREVSTGRIISSIFDADKVSTLETGEFDRNAHKAMAIFAVHSYKEINGDIYDLPQGASLDNDKDKSSPVWTATIDVVEREFSQINLTQDVYIPAPDSLATNPTGVLNVDLTWNINSLSELGTEIERSSSGGGGIGFVLVHTTEKGETSYSDSVPSIGTFHYRVRSIKISNQSEYSNESGVNVL